MCQAMTVLQRVAFLDPLNKRRQRLFSRLCQAFSCTLMTMTLHQMVIVAIPQFWIGFNPLLQIDAPQRHYWDEQRHQCILPLDWSILVVSFLPGVVVLHLVLYASYQTWKKLLSEQKQLRSSARVKLHISYVSMFNMMTTMLAGLFGMIHSHPIAGQMARYASLVDFVSTILLNGFIVSRLFGHHLHSRSRRSSNSRSRMVVTPRRGHSIVPISSSNPNSPRPLR